MTYIPVQHSHCVSRTVDVKVVAIFVRLHQSPAVSLHAARGPRGHAARAGAASRRRGRVAGVAVACFSLLAPRTLSLLAILAVSPLALRRESEGRFQRRVFASSAGLRFFFLLRALSGLHSHLTSR